MPRIRLEKKQTFPILAWMLAWVAGLALAACLFACGSFSPATSTSASPTAGMTSVACTGGSAAGCHIRLLAFSKTAGFRHASIPDAIAALRTLAIKQHVAIDFTENAAIFSDAYLSRYAAVVFLLTTGKVLDAEQQVAFERYIQHGGGFAGVHSASDTGYNWPWYGQLVGAYFQNHSGVVQATVRVVDATHSSTSMLPATWVRSDEWYNFKTNPRNSVHVLLTVDERSYRGGKMGAYHPIAWYHAFDGGRAWYTAMGHTSESYHEPLFLAHLWGGFLYAAGVQE